MNLNLIIQTTYNTRILNQLRLDYPTARILKGKRVPFEDFKDEVLVVDDAERVSKKHLLSFMKRNNSCKIILIVHSLEKLDYKIKNLCSL